MNACRVACLAALLVASLARSANAQGTGQSAVQNDGWDFSIYPIFLWVPVDIGVGVEVPPSGNDGGGIGDIVESQLDGAFFGGVTASNGTWRIEGYGIWTSFGGSRDLPFLTVDMDVIYGDGKIGRRVARDLYITGGLRRVALKYDFTLGTLPRFSRKPGVWDPLAGVGWHRVNPKVEWHASFEGGGFGVGADVDLGATLRVDWKPVRHFGLAGGYNFMYLKLSDTIAGREVIVKPTVHGPSVGFGLYF